MMKAIFRSGAVQGLLAWLTGLYMDLVLHTIRWTHVNQDEIRRDLALNTPGIGLFWHHNIASAVPAGQMLGHRKIRMLISLSPDGEFIANAIASRGIESIRGSAVKKSDPKKDKGGMQAAREALEWLRQGNILVVTPDGPRGPARRVNPGIVRIAARAGVGLYLVGIATKPCRELNTWDHFRLPRPFGRGAVVWHGPVWPPAELTPEAIEATVADWSAQLDAADAQAAAALG